MEGGDKDTKVNKKNGPVYIWIIEKLYEEHLSNTSLLNEESTVKKQIILIHCLMSWITSEPKFMI